MVKDYTPFEFIEEYLNQIPMFCQDPSNPMDSPHSGSHAAMMAVPAPVPLRTSYRRPDGEAVAISLSATATPTGTPSKRPRSTMESSSSSSG